FMLQPKRIQDPKIERIVLRDYMNALVHDLSPVLKDKNLEIIVNDQWNLEYFYYDVKYLNQIFFNIISNSIKNSFEKGKIIVNLIQTNRGDLKIQIADNGSGIPLEEQEVIRKYIQDPGMKVAKANYENIDLLYVKDLIDKLEGAFVFESSKDQGTTFTLILKNQKKDAPLQELESDKEEITSNIQTHPVAPPLPQITA